MNASNIRISFSKTQPSVATVGLCRFQTPCGDPFRCRRLVIENFVSLAG
ncbi:hypothetical protein HMPREF3036_01841 [Sutterella sp. KLE1602]|nr:hypothetical protein HMPREF3036_01841 [Sutterella sp. KLE1602]